MANAILMNGLQNMMRLERQHHSFAYLYPEPSADFSPLHIH